MEEERERKWKREKEQWGTAKTRMETETRRDLTVNLILAFWQNLFLLDFCQLLVNNSTNKNSCKLIIHAFMAQLHYILHFNKV